MGKSEKLIRAWRNGAKFDVASADVLLVLEEYGFDLRPDGQNHWLATHSKLESHPLFPYGRFGINCHYRKQGVVHPKAIGDVLKAIKHLENENDES